MRPVSEHISFLNEMVSKGGPEEKEFLLVRDWMNEIGSAIEKQLYSNEDIELFYQHIAAHFPPDTIHGLIYHKPRKYSGDYELLNRIQSKNISSDPRFKKWDEYFHTCEAPCAVRFRIEYLHDLFLKNAERHPDGFSFLNLSSGSCWDVCEFLKVHPEFNINIECVEHDPDAIQLAGKFFEELGREAHFYHTNIMRFAYTKPYDFQWSAGLFDYLNDEIFVKILKRLITHTNPGGEIVVGNLKVTNPTRYYMLILKWIVFHRTEEQLKRLAREAGADEEQIYVYTEPLGVNMFLHIQC